MSKVFGYPEYDEKGEKILTTYDNEYKAMMMDIRVYRMKAGETRTFLREGEETAVLLLDVPQLIADVVLIQPLLRLLAGTALGIANKNHGSLLLFH